MKKKISPLTLLPEPSQKSSALYNHVSKAIEILLEIDRLGKMTKQNALAVSLILEITSILHCLYLVCDEKNIGGNV